MERMPPMRNWRFKIQIPISLLILVPENPNDTQPHQGRTLDLSSRGMLVQIDGMDIASYKKISANVRLVRVSLKNTITDQQIQVRGCVAWFTYCEPAHCKMGILFDKRDDVGLPAYSDFVNSLRLSRDPLSN